MRWVGRLGLVVVGVALATMFGGCGPTSKAFAATANASVTMLSGRDPQITVTQRIAGKPEGALAEPGDLVTFRVRVSVPASEPQGVTGVQVELRPGPRLVAALQGMTKDNIATPFADGTTSMSAVDACWAVSGSFEAIAIGDLAPGQSNTTLWTCQAQAP